MSDLFMSMFFRHNVRLQRERLFGKYSDYIRLNKKVKEDISVIQEWLDVCIVTKYRKNYRWSNEVIHVHIGIGMFEYVPVRLYFRSEKDLLAFKLRFKEI